MRKIFPDEKQTKALFNNEDNRATKQDINDLSNRIDELDTSLDVVENKLDTYIHDNYESINSAQVNTPQLNAENADITDASITNLDADVITTPRADIANVNAQIVGIQNSLTAPAAIIGDIQSLKLSVGEIETPSLEATTGSFTNIAVENLTQNNISSETIETETLTATGDTSLQDVTAKDVTLSGNIVAKDSEFDNVETSGLLSQEHKVENITWNGEQDLVGLTDKFYITIPHFENGLYCFQILDQGAPKITVEVYNSVDNYLLRWSRSAGYLLTAYKCGEGGGSQMVFLAKNVDGHALKLRYGTTSATENVAAPSESVIAPPVEVKVTYPIAYDDGNKYFKNIDLPNSGVTIGALTISPTDMYDLDTGRVEYDTTEPVNAIRYKPNQSLNKTDDVEFRTVKSTFLDVAELGIQSKITTPHIYDGRSLSAAEIAALNDESLVIQAGISTVSAPDALEIWLAEGAHGYYSPDDEITTKLKGLSDNAADALHNITYETTDYKPSDGYEFKSATRGDIAYTFTSVFFDVAAGIKTGAVIFLDENNDLKVGIIGTPDQFRLDKSFIEVFDLEHIVADDDGETALINHYNSEAYYQLFVNPECNVKLDWGAAFNRNVDDVFYARTPNVTTDPVHTVRIVYPYVAFVPYMNITYTEAGGSGSGEAKITRKTTKNNLPQVLPIIPTDTTVAGSDTLPLKYNSTKDAIEKNTGDLSVGNDLTVANDVTITGDTSIGGDTSITGDTSIGGDTSITGKATVGNGLDVTGDTVLHGDLYVEGTTHSTSQEQLETTSDTLVLRQNNSTSLGASYSGIIVNKYDGLKDLALVTDSDGTLRVGTGAGTPTTYQNIYLKTADGKWYSDSAFTTEVTPSGTLTSWGAVEDITGGKHYTNAVFTVINYSDLVPLLGRDEDTNLNSNGLLVWDGANWIAKTLAMPTTNGQSLVSSSGGYTWATQPHTYVFNTMADYSAVAASVPDGSTVIILSETNYLKGDVIA